MMPRHRGRRTPMVAGLLAVLAAGLTGCGRGLVEPDGGPDGGRETYQAGGSARPIGSALGVAASLAGADGGGAGAWAALVSDALDRSLPGIGDPALVGRLRPPLAELLCALQAGRADEAGVVLAGLFDRLDALGALDATDPELAAIRLSLEQVGVRPGRVERDGS